LVGAGNAGLWASEGRKAPRDAKVEQARQGATD